MERYPILSAGVHDFFMEQEFVLDNICFEYLGGMYKGKGVLTWNPDKGFHLESFVTRYGPPLPSESFGGPKLIRKIDFKTIRMKSKKDKSWIIAPNVPLFGRLDLRLEGRLSTNINSVIFSRPSEILSKKYTGRGLYYGIPKNILFPDTVEKKVTLGDWSLKEKAKNGIIFNESKYGRLIGRRIKDEYLELNWELDITHWKRSHSWIWPQAAADALSILLGNSAQLICREVNRGARVYVEMKHRKSIVSLGILSLFEANYPFNKIRFIRLIDFLIKNSTEAIVCRHIINQMFEAASQKSWQATELLLTSILEATLRTLQGKPFKLNKKKGTGIHIKQSLDKFCKKYKADKLEPFSEKANNVFRRMRHRNAHPDWLYFEVDPTSDKWKSQSFKDMMFLSRFYGYMILYLSGQRDFTPKFSKGPLG